jgi:lysophospholipase L1-like esterase
MHRWSQQGDGLYVVDGAVPVATPAEQRSIDQILASWGKPAYRAGAPQGVDLPTMVAFVQVESGGNPNVVSHNRLTGAPIAYGLMQITPGAFGDVRPGSSLTDMLDPTINLAVGATILGRYKRKGHDLPAIASEYNAGPGPHPADNDWGMRQESVGGDGYLDRIVRAYNYVLLRTLRVMLIGDSITVGVAPAVAAAIEGMPATLVGRSGSGRALHEGVVGDSIARVGARMQEAIADNRPDLVVTMAGTNDVPGRATPAAMARAEAGVLAAAAQRTRALLVLAIPPLPAAAAYGRLDVPAAYDAALQGEVHALAARGLPVVFDDAHLTPSEIGPDGTHPNAAGDAKLAEVIGRDVGAIAALPRPILVPEVERAWYARPVVLIAAGALAVLGGWRVARHARAFASKGR